MTKSICLYTISRLPKPPSGRIVVDRSVNIPMVESIKRGRIILTPKEELLFVVELNEFILDL